jgi:oligoribonuclease NrnB/cAMP/cGMP phosphodiesterase (DHH superfamily)
LNALKREIVHFTHNDLDAIGCMINLEYATPGIQKTTFHTNYQNLNEKVHDTIQYIYKHPVDLLVISDVAFAQTKNELFELTDVAQSLDIKILYIDHHVYEDGFFDDFTFKYVHDIDKSATGLMYDYFNKDKGNKVLEKLSTLINNFDIWVEEASSFPISIGLNNWFTDELKTKSMEQIAQSIVDNDYKLPKNFIPYYKDYQAKFKAHLDSLKSRQLFVNDGFTALIFADEYFNEALYESFHINKNMMAVIVNSYGIFRIRFATVNCLPDETKEAIKYDILGTLDRGHLNAFSIKIDNSNFEKIMAKVQELTTIVNKHKTDKRT